MALVGRLIAAAIFIACAAVVFFNFTEEHARTWGRTMQALGLQDRPGELNAVNQAPGYGSEPARVERGAGDGEG